MADVAETEKTGKAEGEPKEVVVEKKTRKKKDSKVLLVLMSVFVFGIATGGSFYFLQSKKEVAAASSAESDYREAAFQSPQERMRELSKLVYMVLPSMIVNLRTTESGRASLLKCVFVLLLKTEDEVKVIEATKPQILDSFQSLIRELNLEQLEGSAGIERLRQTLTERVNAIISPLRVQKILIKEFLTQ